MDTKDEFEQGFDEDWIDAVPDVYECAVCLMVLNKPVQTSCGHRFCQGCITKVVRDGSQKCPIDNMELPREDGMFPDNYAKREILNLRVRCRMSRDNGCTWTGKLCDLQEHLKICQFKAKDCPNKCGKQFYLKDMEKHLKESCSKRLVTCEYCEIKAIASKLQEHQEQKCKRFPIECPNKCGKSVPKEDIAQHIEGDCPVAVFHCALRDYGCNFKGSNVKMREHWDSVFNHHIQLLVKDNQALRQELQKLEKENTQQMRQEDDPMDTYNGHSPVAASVEKLEEQMRHLDTQISRCSSNVETGRSETVQLRADILSELKSLNAKVKTHDEQIADISSKIWNGKFVWRIASFDKLFREARSGEVPVIHSQPFYTGIPGYKMCLRVNLNGIDSGHKTHLSMFVHLMQGQFDDILPWPFPGSLVLMVLDQDVVGEPKNIRETLAARPNLQAFNRPRTTRNQKGYGYVEMVPHQILRTPKYLRNDSIFVRVDVSLPPSVLDLLQR